MNELVKEMGLKLKKWREASKITQETLASDIDICVATLSKIENGKCIISMHAFILLITKYNLDPCYFLPNPKENDTTTVLLELPTRKYDKLIEAHSINLAEFKKS